jgi:excisionase family DNA binding protein
MGAVLARNPARLLTIPDAAFYLGVSHWTLRDLIWAGTLPYLKLGRRHMLDKHDLDAWIERNKAVA